jgi:hypothetical protein
MIPRWLSVVILLGFGAGLLRVAMTGWREGSVPAGPSLRGRWEPSREAEPIAFVVFVALYFCAGLALCVWGLLAMVGMAPALELGEP